MKTANQHQLIDTNGRMASCRVFVMMIYDFNWILWPEKVAMQNHGQNMLMFNEVRPDTPPLWHLPFASGFFWKLMKQTGFPCVQTASVQRSSSRRAFWVMLMLFDTGSHKGANTRTHTYAHVRTHTHAGQRNAALSRLSFLDVLWGFDVLHTTVFYLVRMHLFSLLNIPSLL